MGGGTPRSSAAASSPISSPPPRAGLRRAALRRICARSRSRGVPLILNLGAPWEKIQDAGVDRSTRRRQSFVAGLSTAPAIVRGADAWACVELRLTPRGAHRLLGVPMSELANQTVELEQVLPQARELGERLREARRWSERFDLVDSFLTRRLADSPQTDASGNRVVVAPSLQHPGSCSDRRDRRGARLESPPPHRALPRADRADPQAARAGNPVRPRGHRDSGVACSRAGRDRFRVRVLRSGSPKPRVPGACRNEPDHLPRRASRFRWDRRLTPSISSKTARRGHRTLRPITRTKEPA